MVALLAGLIVDGARSEPIEGGALIVESDRIVEALEDRAGLPSGCSVIDLGDRTLIPGLIDAHMHFLGVPSNEEYQHLHFESEALRALRASQEAGRMVRAGITSARCLGSSIGPALRRAIDEGRIVGPRLVAAGKFICATDGTWDHVQLPLEWVRERGIVADGADGVAAMVRQRIREGATVIKLGLSKAIPGDAYHAWGDDPRQQVACYSDEEIAAAIREAHRHGLNVSAHCIGDAAVRQAMAIGIDVVEHGYGIDEGTRQMLASRRQLVVSTLSQLHFHLRAADAYHYPSWLCEVFSRHFEVMQRDFELSLAAGVRFALGTDLVGLPTHPLDQVATEFELAVGLGMRPVDALRAGTRLAAEALGWDDRLGTLEAGKLADVVAVRGNPLEHIETLRNVDFVMQGGVVRRSL